MPRFSSYTVPGTDGVDRKLHKMAVAALIFGAPAMPDEPTTVIIQR